MSLYVKVTNNKVDFALRKFKKKVKDSGLMKEIQERQFYGKPSLEKRRKRMKAKLRAQSRSKKAEL